MPSSSSSGVASLNPESSCGRGHQQCWLSQQPRLRAGFGVSMPTLPCPTRAFVSRARSGRCFGSASAERSNSAGAPSASWDGWTRNCRRRLSSSGSRLSPSLRPWCGWADDHRNERSSSDSWWFGSSFHQALRRFMVGASGSFTLRHPGWHPPVNAWLLVLTNAGAAVGLVAVMLKRSQPAAVAADPGMPTREMVNTIC